MRYRHLGNTALQVSELTLGTAELGMPYGFRGGHRYEPPDRSSAIRLIHRALDLGFNLFDTAPAYGNSEEIIGAALREVRQRPFIASKVTIPAENVGQGIRASIDNSLRRLGCERLDLVQIHNPEPRLLQDEEVLRTLDDAVAIGKVRFAGASVYQVDEARAALSQSFFRTLQVPFNLLDQQMKRHIFAQAQTKGIGILVRSVFLRGVLTDDASDLPEKIQPLRASAERALTLAGRSVTGLAELALRFCLTIGGISSLLIGVRSIAELEANVAAAERGALEPEYMERLRGSTAVDGTLVSPLNWTGLI